VFHPSKLRTAVAILAAGRSSDRAAEGRSQQDPYRPRERDEV